MYRYRVQSTSSRFKFALYHYRLLYIIVEHVGISHNRLLYNLKIYLPTSQSCATVHVLIATTQLLIYNVLARLTG